MSCINRLGSVRIPRHAVCHSQARLFTVTVLQRVRPSPIPKEVYALRSHSRSLWWSSSPKLPPVESAQEQPATDVVPGVPPVSESPAVESTSTVSSTSTLDSPSLTGSTLPDTSTDVSLPDVSAALPTLSPLHYGDLAALGLAGWTPAGLCRWGMELLQVSTGMPWFWTIVGATLISRVVLFPFAARSMRSTAALAPHQDEINDLRQKMTAAQQSRDMLQLQSVAMKQQIIYEKAGVSMASMAILPIVQLPVTLGMFFGVKKLCDFPLEQLKDSGVSFIPDLTVADPTGILPVMTAVAMNIQLSVGARDMMTAPHMAHMINLFRVLSLVGIPLMWNLPSGALVYVITSIVGMTLQSAILRSTTGRKLLGIPILQKQHETKGASFKESIDYAKQWWQEKKAEQEAAIKGSRRR